MAPARPVVMFINLWPQSGMKHYSESLVHALLPAAKVLYVRNYESSLTCESLRVDLDPLRPKCAVLWRLLGQIVCRRPLAIHLNSELPALLPLFPLLAFCNSVITLHDAKAHAGERLAKRLFMWLHLLLVFLCIRKVIVHSAAIRAQLPAFLQRRVFTLPHVNYNLWASQASVPTPARPFTVLFFGRLLRYKGLEFLLEAFAQLEAGRFSLVIAGEGDLSAHHLDPAKVRTINRFIADEEMAALFNAAHVVVVPYVAASQSGVVYMAFAFGKPVIATRVGGLADVVVDDFNGFLIEPRSSTAIAAALEHMASPETYARLAENVRQQSVSADEEIRARLLEIYRAGDRN